MNVTASGSLDLTEILREIFRHTPVGVVLLDLHGTILEVNEASCSLIGYDRELLIGRDVSFFLQAEDVPRAEKYLAGLRDGETGSQRIVHRLQSREEDVISVATTLSVVRTDDGEAVFCIAFIEDISERLRMENALRESESLYRQVVEDQPNLIVRAGADGVRTFANRAYRRFFGVDAQEPANQGAMFSVAVADREAYQRNFSATVDAPPPANQMFRVMAADGNERWTEWSNQAFFDDSGKLVSLQSIGHDVTSRVEALDALRASESRYRRLFEDLPVAAYESDWSGIVDFIRANGIGSTEELMICGQTRPQLIREGLRRLRLVAVNSSALALTGVSDRTAFVAWPQSGYPSESIPTLLRCMGAIIFDGAGTQKSEMAIRTAAGELRTVFFQWGRIRTTDNDWRIINTILDLSERKQMEEALRRSEQIYRQLFHNLPVAVWESDWSGALQIWQRDGVSTPEQALAWLGDGKREVAELAALRELREANQDALLLAAAPDFEAFRQWTLTAIRAEDTARVVPVIASVILGRIPAVSVEVRVERCDGVMIDVEMQVAAQEGSAGRIINTAVDVTEKKRIERELLHSQMLLEHAQSSAHIGSWEVDFERDELFASREYWNILSGSGDGPRRRQLSEALLAIHPDDRAGVMAAMQRNHESFVSGAGLGEESYEFRIVRGESTRLASGQASFSRTSEGEFRGYGILRDITEQRKAEEAAQRQREELARADRMISLGVLVSGVAHEINNPNHLIMLNTPLLRSAWSDVAKIVDAYAAEHPDLRIANLPWTEMREEFPQVIDEISEGSERIRSIVAELRGFGRDQQPAERRPASVNDIIQRSLRLLGNHIRKATTRFTLDLGDDLPLVEANSHRLEQVVVNLVINSCQALERPDAAVLVRTSFDRTNGRVEIRVIDEGRGIPRENLPKIRDPFFTTKRSEGGTGLGLAVSERIVLEHNATLTFVSEPGAGTTATLSIPVAPRN